MKNPQPPVVLDVETRVRDWTVTRVLDPVTPGMQEAVAEDAHGTPVLLRVPADADAIERVFAEAALARRHRHWGIVQTIGVVDQDGWPIQVVEHVDGMTLDTVSMLAGSLAPEAVCRVGSQIAMILVELHREPGSFHGALSGERVLVDAAGHVRLADLGRARPEQLFRLLSPERRAAGGVGSPEDDIYALGGLLIEAALGRPLERTIGWIDTRALGGVLPERLIDALDALVAPSGKRLKNAAAVMRVFETLETMLGDGPARLKKAVEYARLGAALGTPARGVRQEDAPPDAETETELARQEPFAPFTDEAPTDELEATNPGSVPPFVPFANSAPPAADEPSTEETQREPAAVAALAEQFAEQYAEQRAKQRAEQFFADAPTKTTPAQSIDQAVQAKEAADRAWPTAKVQSAMPAKKKWPLFSRMIAWAFLSLVGVNLLAALWVLAEPPLSRVTGTALPKIPYSDLSLDQLAMTAFSSALSSAPSPVEGGGTGLALGGPGLGGANGEDFAAELAKLQALDAPAPTAFGDEPAAAAPAGGELPALTKDEEQQLAAAFAALAAELEKAKPAGEGGALFDAAPAEAIIGDAAPVGDAAPAWGAPTPGSRPIGVPRRKAAVRPTEVVAPEPVKAAPEPVKVAKPSKVEKPAKHEAVSRPEPAAKPAPVAKAPKAEPAPKAERAEKASSTERRIIGSAEPARAARPVKLSIEAPAAMRARAEAKLRDCELEEAVNGVVRVGNGGKIRSVTTDPLNTCVAKTLKATMEGFSEDQPFEVTP